MPKSLLSAQIICREALVVLDWIEKGARRFPCEIVGRAERFVVDLGFEEKDLELSLDDFSHRIVMPAMTFLSRRMPMGETVQPYLSQGNSSVECFGRIWLRYRMAADVELVQPNLRACFDIVVRPDQYEISG